MVQVWQNLENYFLFFQKECSGQPYRGSYPPPPAPSSSLSVWNITNSFPPLCVPPQRHFSVFALSFPGAEALSTIYTSILSQHLRGEGFGAVLQKCCPTLVQLALALHQRVSSTFLPTAVKFHYIFNLRDLSNIFQVREKNTPQKNWFNFKSFICFVLVFCN